MADVIPGSGMLSLVAAEAPDQVFGSMAELATTSDARNLDRLLLMPTYFTEDRPGVALDGEARRSAGLSSTGRQAHPPRPSSRLEVASATPSPSFSPCSARPAPRRSDDGQW